MTLTATSPVFQWPTFDRKRGGDIDNVEEHRLWMMKKTGVVAVSINRMVGLLNSGQVRRNVKIFVRKSSEEVCVRASHSVDVGRYEDQAGVFSCTTLDIFLSVVIWGRFINFHEGVDGREWFVLWHSDEFPTLRILPSGSSGYDFPRMNIQM